jgi:transmembrane sensor
MKAMNNTERFTDKEWEELASLLSGEKKEKSELLTSFLDADTYGTEKLWKELRDMSSQKEIDVDKAWNNVYSKIIKAESGSESIQSPIRTLRYTFLKVAAVALILLSLGTTAVYLNNAGYFSSKITLSTGNDQKNLLVDLPDGSKIFLNRNTVLSYRADFGKHRRDVRLTGEAFFDISHDASKPFIIDAGKAKVKVVGTSFNVITQNAESAVEVYVKTGKVILSDNSGSQSLVLDPEYVGTINSETSGKVVNNDPNRISWRTNHLVYNGQKLDVVFSDLKKVHNMDIVADDSDILNNTWTSSFDNQSQDTIIRLICISFNLSYTKEGSVYHLAKK